jgi:hypothetical protein
MRMVVTIPTTSFIVNRSSGLCSWIPSAEGRGKRER